MGSEQRRRAATLAISVAVLAGAGTVRAAAQLFPPIGPTQQPTSTTTTAPPPTTLPVEVLPTDPTAPPESSPPSSDTTPPAGDQPAPADPGPAPADPGEGAEGAGGGIVPPEAQAIINAIPRTAPNDNQALLEGVAALESAGMAHDDAVRQVFGPFPILGPARWSDDWYYPRWTGTTFRFHLGLDMLADYGTPVGSPADGVARIAESALGGLTVSVVQPDGTFWYLAHLSGLADGLVDGTTVAMGQVVGYVGTSGNAVGGPPHLHFAVHPRGGDPVPPKPIVDQWVADGAARVVDLLAITAAAPRSAAVIATDLTRRLADGVSAGPVNSGPPRTELLWATAASPNGGAVAVADATAASLSEAVDWDRRGAEQRSLDLAWAQAVERAQQLLAPLVSPTLRRALEIRRAAAVS